MARVRLIHWNGPEGRERRLRLASLGHEAFFDDCDGPALGKILRANLPEAFVIDLSRLPSHGREVALSLRSSKSMRLIPIVFVDGDPEKVKTIKALLPDATYTTWGRIKTALPRAIAHAPTTPVATPPPLYSDKRAVEKLGIKEGMRVALLGAPPGFAAVLKPLPARVKLTAKPDADSGIIICVVRRRRELDVQFVGLARAVDRQTLWMVWPKKASGVPSEINGNMVRETGLATGWVDFKVCSVDDTWSGLAFKRRK